jgi:hypothetical protein
MVFSEGPDPEANEKCYNNLEAALEPALLISLDSRTTHLSIIHYRLSVGTGVSTGMLLDTFCGLICLLLPQILIQKL